MKKLLFLLAIVFTANVTFAKDNTIDNAKVLNGFREEFGNIADVSWHKTDNSFVARFSLKASKVTAHFDEDGNLLAMSRHISDSQLPSAVITRLIKKFPDQAIRNVVEYVSDNMTRYVITLESETNWTVLKAEENGGLSVLTKLKKS